MEEKKKPVLGKIILRFFLVLICTVLILALFLVAVIGVMCKGPSTEAKRLFVLSVNETSAIYWLPRIFMSESEVDAILNPEDEPAPEKISDFVELPREELASEDGTEESPDTRLPSDDPTVEEEIITLLDVKGSTYKGKVMIITDPSLVVFGTLKSYGSGSGMYLTKFIEKYNAIGGTNAGGFEDENGQGNGGTPDGIVIRDGQIIWGYKSSKYKDVIGFDADYVMHVGNMTGKEALEMGIVNAVSFADGPVLIQDGVKKTNLGGGLNPRTCIGQRADGAVVLVVLEGRRADSLGATFDDLADLMESYGCVNAANLDGGSSSQMYYNGEAVTRRSVVVGPRKLATAILVLDPNGDDNNG